MSEESNENLNKIEEEALFSIEELFVSRTDKQSIIQSGNKVFSRISDYSINQMIGRPHNLIRHPDMPKSIFKFLWSELNKNHVFCGYVKNKSKEGKFYWVLAVVFPTDDGYLSVRIKPSTELKSLVEGVYKETLEIESQKGVQSGLEFLIQKIQSLGFNDYQSFMHHLLKVELFSRDQKISHLSETIIEENEVQSKKTSREQILFEIKKILSNVVSHFRESSHNVIQFENLKKECTEGNKIVEDVFSKLECLSVNMSIAAHKLGKEGSALAIVASTFQDTANQVIKEFFSFQEKIESLTKEFDKVFFSVLCSRAQIEMLNFQMSEVIEDISTGYFQNPIEEKENIKNVIILNKQIHKIFHENMILQHHFFEKLFYMNKSIQNIKEMITRLDLIRTGGKLEGSRSSQIVEAFMPFVSKMEAYVKTVDEPVNGILLTMNKAVLTFDSFISQVKIIEHSIDQTSLLLEMIMESNQDKNKSA